MRFRLVAAMYCLFLGVHPGSYGAENALSATRTGIEQWVRTRQLISRTRADWETEKETLLQSKALYERELAGIDEQMSKVSTNSTQVDRERVAAEADLANSNEALDRARTEIAKVEAAIRDLLPRLPVPLTETMQPLLARLPEDPATAKTPVTERVQTVVSLLNEIDKFNNAVTLASEKRTNEAGEEIAVETVYIGLGAAYFVNQTGDFGGSGRPGPKGWEWVNDRSLSASVREVVRMYRNERTAAFVSLPLSIQ